MKVIDFGAYFVIYNFIIGVLLMIASEKLGVYAGHLVSSRGMQIARLTRVATCTFGAVLASLMAVIYVAGYILKL